MVGRLILKHHKTGETKKIYFTSITDEIMAKVKNTAGLSLYCDCNSEHIELKVGLRDGHYYLYNAKKGYRDKHDPRCPRYASYTGKSEYDTGWKQKGDIYAATLSSDIFSIDKEANRKIVIRNRPYSPSTKGYINPETRKGEVTLLGLVTKLNLIAWERFSRTGKLPNDINEFLKKVYGTMKKIKLTNKRIDSLQAINYDYAKAKTLKEKKDFLFVYMKFLNVEEDPYNSERVRICCEDTWGNIRRFYYGKTEFYEIYDSLRFKNQEEQTIFIGGFAYKTSANSIILTFNAICMFVVNALGLYCESSHELEVYNRLCASGRLFYKPYFSIPEYGDLTPDFILLDTKKPVIGEIFGFNSAEYLMEREHKIQLAAEIRNEYGFWKWDAYKNDEIPEFPIADRIKEV